MPRYLMSERAPAKRAPADIWRSQLTSLTPPGCVTACHSIIYKYAEFGGVTYLRKTGGRLNRYAPLPGRVLNGHTADLSYIKHQHGKGERSKSAHFSMTGSKLEGGPWLPLLPLPYSRQRTERFAFGVALPECPPPPWDRH